MVNVARIELELILPGDLDRFPYAVVVVRAAGTLEPLDWNLVELTVDGEARRLLEVLDAGVDRLSVHAA